MSLRIFAASSLAAVALGVVCSALLNTNKWIRVGDNYLIVRVHPAACAVVTVEHPLPAVWEC